MPEWFLPVSLVVLTAAISIVVVGYRKMKEDTRNLQERLAIAETKIEPYWARVQRKLAEELHSPHTPELDELMKDLAAGNLTAKRRVRLEELLLVISHDPKESQARHDSAEIMIRLMRKVLVEAATVK